MTKPRSEGMEVDRATVEMDAKALFKAGEKRLGTDEKTFIRIFSERSRAHMAAVGSAYYNMYGNSLRKVTCLLNSVLKIPCTLNVILTQNYDYYQAVKSETSGCFEFGLLTILRCSENPAKYFAKVKSGFRATAVEW